MVSPISFSSTKATAFVHTSAMNVNQMVHSIALPIFTKLKEMFSTHFLFWGSFDLNFANLFSLNTKSNESLRENIHKTEELQKSHYNETTLINHTDLARKIFCDKASDYLCARITFALISRQSVPESIFMQIAKETSTPVGAGMVKPSFLSVFWRCLGGRLNCIQKVLAVTFYIFIGSWLPKFVITQFTTNFVATIRNYFSSKSGVDIQNTAKSFLEQINAFFDIYLGSMEKFRKSNEDVTELRDDFIKKEITKPNAIKDKRGKTYKLNQLYRSFSNLLITNFIPKISISSFIFSKIYLSSWKPKWKFLKVIKFTFSLSLGVPLGSLSILFAVIQWPCNFFIHFFSKNFLTKLIPSILEKGIESIGSGTPFSHALNSTLCFHLREMKKKMDSINSDNTTIDNKILEKTHSNLRHLIKNLLDMLYKEPLRSKKRA